MPGLSIVKREGIPEGQPPALTIVRRQPIAADGIAPSVSKAPSLASLAVPPGPTPTLAGRREPSQSHSPDWDAVAQANYALATRTPQTTPFNPPRWSPGQQATSAPVINPKTGRPVPTPVPFGESFLDVPAEGARQVGQGIGEIVQSGVTMGPGIPTMVADPSRTARGASDVIRGGMGLASVVLPGALAVAPVAAPVYMALAAGASKAATYAATAAGLPQAFADLAGDLAALLAIGKGGKAVLDRIAQSKLAGRGVNVAERIAADAVTAVTKGRTSVLPADPTATVASPPPVLDDIVINAQTEGAAARLASVKVSDVLSPGLFDELAPAQRVEHATGLERDAAYEPVRGLPTLTIVDVAPITPAERPNAEAPIGPIEANAPIDTAVQYAPTIISAEPIPASDTDTMPVSTPGAMTTRTVHATDLTLSPQEYQFKESDATGQTGRLREVEQWDELQGKVSPVIVHELRDGRLMVVDGHQRVNLAHRLVREGKTVPMLDALVLRETDGWTAPDVRRQAALVNTRLNNASPIDIAKVVRESPLTPAETASIPRGNVEGERFAQAVELAKLSDVAFHAVVNGEIAPNFAQAVGRYVADPALQILAIRSLAKADLANAYQADRFVKELIKDADATETQQDMFGPQAVAVSLAKEKAQVVNAVANALRDQKSAFGNAFRNATRLEAAGNTLNRSANERMMSAAQRFAALLDSFADTTGATSRAITEAARNVHAGTSKPTDATDTIIAALETDFRAGRTETPGPSASGLEHTADGREAGDRGRGGADLQSEHAADAREESPPVTRAELESAGQSSLFGEDAPAEAVADRPVRFSPPTALPRFAPPATRQLQARVTRSRNAPRKTD